MRITWSALLSAILLLLAVACGETHQPATEAAGTEAAEQGPEYTSAYICPMHCTGSGSDQAGVCPVCGMDYVANAADAPSDETEEDHHHHEGDEHDH